MHVLVQIATAGGTARRVDGATRAMTLTNYAFAGSFFFCRVVLFGCGLAHMYAHRALVAPLVRECPPLGAVVVLFVGGYGLNLVWFRQIVNIARGRGKHKKAT